MIIASSSLKLIIRGVNSGSNPHWLGEIHWRPGHVS
jgi:hypothetical protein